MSVPADAAAVLGDLLQEMSPGDALRALQAQGIAVPPETVPTVIMIRRAGTTEHWSGGRDGRWRRMGGMAYQTVGVAQRAVDTCRRNHSMAHADEAEVVRYALVELTQEAS